MPTEGYRVVTEYHFEVHGEVFAITDSTDDMVWVEEVRKNGQEDCHVSGCLIRRADGKFVWDEGEHLFMTYGSRGLADGIRHYLDDYGIPG